MSLEKSAQAGLIGVGLGAGATYLLDLARHAQAARGNSRTGLGDHAGGEGPVVDQLARLHRQDGSDFVAAEVLVARVRAVIGHTVSHPTSVAVGIDDDLIRLSGPILAREASDLLREVRRMAGSRRVEDALQRYRRSTRPPVLRARGSGLWPRHWRVMSAGAGFALGLGGIRLGGMRGGLLAAAGGALLVRAATNRSLTGELSTHQRAGDGHRGDRGDDLGHELGHDIGSDGGASAANASTGDAAPIRPGAN